MQRSLEDLVILTLTDLNLQHLFTGLTDRLHLIGKHYLSLSDVSTSCCCFVGTYHLLKPPLLVLVMFLSAVFPSTFLILLSLRRKISLPLCLRVCCPLVRSEALSLVPHRSPPSLPAVLVLHPSHLLSPFTDTTGFSGREDSRSSHALCVPPDTSSLYILLRCLMRTLSVPFSCLSSCPHPTGHCLVPFQCIF